MEPSIILLFLFANLIVALLLRYFSIRIFAGPIKKQALFLNALVLLGMPNVGLFWIVLDVLDADLGRAFRDYVRLGTLGFALPVILSIHSLVANLGRRKQP
ncbi:MAG: hypothetical protein Q9M48_06500 [Rhodobacterales bacterium]|nr:hypothetical protein [Rhodobacterales bacterium]